LTKNGHPALNGLQEAGYEVIFSTAGQLPSEQELLSILPGCVGMLAGIEPKKEDMATGNWGEIASRCKEVAQVVSDLK
jgi:hypothetical protein